MSSDEKKICAGSISRRQWMVGSGAVAAAAALTRLGGWLPQALAKQSDTQKWPWPYVKLDPTTTGELAYREWYRLYCGGAVISSVFSQLREKVGEPYTSFPVDAFMFLEGGMASWGTVCGSNAGANIVANMIFGPRIYDKNAIGHHMGADILEWYSNASLPIFQPKEPKIKEKTVQTISESPLCHVSVGKWMAVADKPVGSPERKDRCARVAASVAYHLVELLNQWKDGTYEPQGEWTPISDYGINAQPNCSECHGGDVPEAPRAQKS